jgi:hypothetical protein
MKIHPKELRKLVDNIKLTAGCQICGYRKHPAALCFDHIEPEQKYKTKNGNKVHIADMVKGGRYGLKTILLEIKKCRVLCSNCHMEYTHGIQRGKVWDQYSNGVENA